MLSNFQQMEEMMKDPEKKRRVEQFSQAFKASL